jgi:hypothetical protein
MSSADQAEIVLVAALGLLGTGAGASVVHATSARRHGTAATGLEAVPRWAVGLVLVGIAATVFGLMVFVGNRPGPSPN